MGPYKSALVWEGSVDGGDAPWCAINQSSSVEFVNTSDLNRVKATSTYMVDSKAFEQAQVSYKKTDDGATFNVIGHN
jgi:hypothetical protein